MKCPECKAKITTKNYDPDFDWYECSKCEGCFTADEIEEAESGTSPARRRSNARDVSSGVDDLVGDVRRTKTKVVAKGKKRRTEIQEDDEAVAKHEAEMLKPVKKDAPETHRHRDDVPTRQVVNIMADEIQAVYEEMGGRIDEVNAQDKALILWRQVKIDTGISAREIDVPHILCSDHA